MILRALMRVPRPEAQRISLQRDVVAARLKRAEASFGDDRASAESMVAEARVKLTSMLLNAGDVKGASAEWSLVSHEQARLFDPSIEIRLAYRTGTLAALLERYRSIPADAPLAEMLQRAAGQLRRDGDENAARAVLEYFYDREIRSGRLITATFWAWLK